MKFLVLLIPMFTLGILTPIQAVDVSYSKAQSAVGYLSRKDPSVQVRHQAFLILSEWILHDEGEFRIPTDELLKLLEEDPASFYKWMLGSETGSKLIDQWLNSLDTSSFTAGYLYDDKRQMEQRRRHLIELVTSQKLSDEKQNQLRLKILNTLNGITVSEVN